MTSMHGKTDFQGARSQFVPLYLLAQKEIPKNCNSGRKPFFFTYMKTSITNINCPNICNFFLLVELPQTLHQFFQNITNPLSDSNLKFQTHCSFLIHHYSKYSICTFFSSYLHNAWCSNRNYSKAIKLCLNNQLRQTQRLHFHQESVERYDAYSGHVLSFAKSQNRYPLWKAVQDIVPSNCR